MTSSIQIFVQHELIDDYDSISDDLAQFIWTTIEWIDYGAEHPACLQNGRGRIVLIMPNKSMYSTCSEALARHISKLFELMNDGRTNGSA